ncbi:hypothetical protein tb265_20470 [Gemmatimonadetes bacterium T265]|nr:hypothetical protein tb265_20470 [Gemmatimonadetes bacterium T265]
MTSPSQSTLSSAPPYGSGYGDLTARPSTPTSGLNEDEARGFNSVFFASFVGFTVIAAIAHFLVWQWRPWIPGAAGYPTRTAQTAPAVKAEPAAHPAVQLAAATPTPR